LTASKTGNLDMQDNIPKEKAEPASNETVWAFDPGNVPRPSDGRRWRTRQADGVTDAEFNQAAEQACVNGTWAKFRANYVGVVAGMTRTSVGTVRRAVRARKAGAMIPAALPPGTSQRDVPTTDGRAQALEREANIIADLPRIYGKERRKAQGQTLNAKMNFVRTVSAFSLQPSAFPSPVQPVSKEALITRSRK
jgi:hypothetical protein